jgi:hypothetical protein
MGGLVSFFHDEQLLFSVAPLMAECWERLGLGYGDVLVVPRDDLPCDMALFMSDVGREAGRRIEVHVLSCLGGSDV